MKRLNISRERAAAQLTAIETSIIALADEDLLDFADIFRSKPDSVLGQLALAEMKKRNIRL
ncbi:MULTISPECIES: hypothetical protein [unclassified Sphingomonas]|jgi:hypothetical protein|uniref:hypothetical protein n=1 Tax=unclassified Sphingomonas TaxID=196159 RepID=UPI000F7D8094|nr:MULTISPECIES: hypothetical protein [unclassified Sphingomonas]RSU46605.1 hypothetical protein BRX43_15455 [Sphingomonas sp. S-NIH.Pt15_0812]